jgi:hypothetical protein
MKTYIVWVTLLSVLVMGVPSASAVNPLLEKRKSPVEYGTVYATCHRFHTTEVLTACNYLCLYDRDCRDTCIENSEVAVIKRECGTPKKK